MQKCLLREMANEDMYHRIQRTIDAIPPKLRCSKGVCSKSTMSRLELCKECEKIDFGAQREITMHVLNYARSAKS